MYHYCDNAHMWVCVFKMCIKYFLFGTLISVWISSISVTVVPFAHNWFTYCVLKYMCVSEEMCVCVAEQTSSCWKFQMTLKMGFERCYSTRICELTAVFSVSTLRVSQCICSIFLNIQKVQESSTHGIKIFRTCIGFVDGSRHIIEIC